MLRYIPVEDEFDEVNKPCFRKTKKLDCKAMDLLGTRRLY